MIIHTSAVANTHVELSNNIYSSDMNKVRSVQCLSGVEQQNKTKEDPSVPLL